MALSNLGIESFDIDGSRTHKRLHIKNIYRRYRLCFACDLHNNEVGKGKRNRKDLRSWKKYRSKQYRVSSG